MCMSTMKLCMCVHVCVCVRAFVCACMCVCDVCMCLFLFKTIDSINQYFRGWCAFFMVIDFHRQIYFLDESL